MKNLVPDSTWFCIWVVSSEHRQFIATVGSTMLGIGNLVINSCEMTVVDLQIKIHQSHFGDRWGTAFVKSCHMEGACRWKHHKFPPKAEQFTTLNLICPDSELVVMLNACWGPQISCLMLLWWVGGVTKQPDSPDKHLLTPMTICVIENVKNVLSFFVQICPSNWCCNFFACECMLLLHFVKELFVWLEIDFLG